jgi:demethylmenaquinone methyltransferase/2-methoxy-6-polyprenyl-1,4-benzoquinol methylase
MNEREWFNNLAKGWDSSILDINYEIAKHLVERLGIKKEHSVCDVGAGTGILYAALKDVEVYNYTALDISEGMIAEFLKSHGNVDARCVDFEDKILLENNFDYVIVFNSIPHFNNLHRVFQNAYNNLKFGGKFVIAHSKTRQGLKEHHKKIGYKSNKENPIPLNEVLIQLGNDYSFKNIDIQDEGYFYFSCEK